MIDFFKQDCEEGLNYVKNLSIITSLSRLFSDSDKPFLHYRVMENLFCQCFKAHNLSRSDTAYDAKIGTLGVGLKTFLCDKFSIEKVAEFNKNASSLKKITNLKDLASKIATLRNDRINLAKYTYGIETGIYHIIVRQDKKLIFFQTDYDEIDISNLRDIKENRQKNRPTSLSFSDGKNEYFFNYSKSVLQRKFILPPNFNTLEIQILENPFEILLSLKDKISNLNEVKQQNDYIILPLFSMRGGKNVPQKSGLNQWNASGRKRDDGEVYIPVPSDIHKFKPNFFPKGGEIFSLKTPTDEILKVKLCQEGSKALMSNPNNAISDWLLRKILKLKPRELLTIEYLEDLGIDSIRIEKTKDKFYEIDIAKWGSYEKFISKFKSEVLDEN